ncbi:hypothetical protein [Sphingobium chungangianum]|jgi:hypothetical protein
MALAERQALAAIDAYELPDEAVTVDARGRVVTGAYDLTHWKHAIGTSISLEALMADPTALLAWLGADGDRHEERVPSRRAVWELVPAIEAWSRHAKLFPPPLPCSTPAGSPRCGASLLPSPAAMPSPAC